jgi:hypothetical protein
MWTSADGVNVIVKRDALEVAFHAIDGALG